MGGGGIFFYKCHNKKCMHRWVWTTGCRATGKKILRFSPYFLKKVLDYCQKALPTTFFETIIKNDNKSIEKL